MQPVWLSADAHHCAAVGGGRLITCQQVRRPDRRVDVPTLMSSSTAGRPLGLCLCRSAGGGVNASNAPSAAQIHHVSYSITRASTRLISSTHARRQRRVACLLAALARPSADRRPCLLSPTRDTASTPHRTLWPHIQITRTIRSHDERISLALPQYRI